MAHPVTRGASSIVSNPSWRADGSEPTQAERRGLACIVGLALLLTLVGVALAPDYGVTWDERPRHAYGLRVLEFLRGERARSDFQRSATGGHLYAALFDTTAAALHGWVGGDVWTVRHRLNAVFGGIGLVAAGVLAARLFGTSTGLIAVVLLACSPRFVGHSMNNPKDLPFAALSAVALLAFTAARQEFPFLSWPRTVLVGLALALPLNVRPGALLYLAFAGLLLLALTVRARAWTPARLASTGARFAAIAGVMLLAGTVFWPWAQVSPWSRPIEALLEASRFEWRGMMLFLGRDVLSSRVPADYVPVWMAITIPPVVILGAVLAAWRTAADQSQRLVKLGLWTAVTLPIALVVLRGSTLYDGWRHLLFVYPPLVVLSASGWRDVLHAASSQRYRRVAAAVLAVGCLEPIVFMVRNHPNEVVYFNALVGGPRGALGRFELDYWGNSIGQAASWGNDLGVRSGMPLGVGGWPPEIITMSARRHRAIYPADGHGPAQQHLEVQLLRHPQIRLREMLARRGALHVIRMADGTPLAVIFPGRDFEAVRARVLPHVGSAPLTVAPEQDVPGRR